jgi:hypothetical protein
MNNEFEDEFGDETDAERAAREATAVHLDETSQQFVDGLVDQLMKVCNALSGHELRPYQTPLASRLFESVLIGDGSTITALMARQVGKTETIANVVATCMIMLPRLARIYPRLLGKFAEGVLVGAFAPVEEQAGTLFDRIVGCLSSDTASDMLRDPSIDDMLIGRGRQVSLKRCGSLVRRTTCHPRATIEGRTYHIILVDECQFADDRVINKSVAPMGAANRATMVFTGTPTIRKNVFYEQIQKNKRKETRRSRKYHFQVDWKEAGKYNENYRLFVMDEMLRLGEDSNEFKLSYKCMWLLDQGMFTSSEKLDTLGDTSMQSLVHAWHATPVVVGIDCGRKQDRTIVTVVYVDWDNPDPFGLYMHRILSWKDLEHVDWEEQYFIIKEYLANYNVWKIAIDSGGLGDVVSDRLARLMPYTEIVNILSAPAEQSRRWKHLLQLMDRGLLAYPAGAKVRNLRVWKRFHQEMEDLELEYKGPHITAQAPKAANAHDDYPDSLALACVLSLDEGEGGTVTVFDNFFY